MSCARRIYSAKLLRHRPATSLRRYCSNSAAHPHRRAWPTARCRQARSAPAGAPPTRVRQPGTSRRSRGAGRSTPRQRAASPAVRAHPFQRRAPASLKPPGTHCPARHTALLTSRRRRASHGLQRLLAAALRRGRLPAEGQKHRQLARIVRVRARIRRGMPDQPHDRTATARAPSLSQELSTLARQTGSSLARTGSAKAVPLSDFSRVCCACRRTADSCADPTHLLITEKTSQSCDGDMARLFTFIDTGVAWPSLGRQALTRARSPASGPAQPATLLLRPGQHCRAKVHGLVSACGVWNADVALQRDKVGSQFSVFGLVVAMLPHVLQDGSQTSLKDLHKFFDGTKLLQSLEEDEARCSVQLAALMAAGVQSSGAAVRAAHEPGPSRVHAAAGQYPLRVATSTHCCAVGAAGGPAAADADTQSFGCAAGSGRVPRRV